MKKRAFRDEFDFVSETLKEIFSPAHLNQFARETNFVQREGKVDAKDFVALCVFVSQKIGKDSLNELCGTLDAHRNTSLSAEGLNQRFNPAAVKFLKKVFSECLTKNVLESSGFSHTFDQFFNRIRILDSTAFGMPSDYSDQYKSPTGTGVKIQLEYELIRGDFLHLLVQQGIASDQKTGQRLGDTIKPKDLCIRDLGYFSYDALEEIDDGDAYYLTRLKPSAAIYVVEKIDSASDRRYKRLYLEEVMEKMEPTETKEFEEVFIGGTAKLPTRLVVYKHTEEQTGKRLAARNRKEKKKGVKYSRRIKKLSAITTYITNIPSTYVSKHEIHSLYSIRWQIEILFKTWKSLFSLDKVKKMKQERFECHLYGTLLSLLVSSMITFKLRNLLYRKNKKEASEFKAMGIAKKYLVKIQEALLDKKILLSEVIKKIYKMMEKNGRKSQRFKKKTVFDILGVSEGREMEKAG
ncbi:IS4 family transposase [Pseudalkalibacillus caeni]|nr:IS4 family transposase [Pseudalkalibacillus caeni]